MESLLKDQERTTPRPSGQPGPGPQAMSSTTGSFVAQVQPHHHASAAAASPALTMPHGPRRLLDGLCLHTSTIVTASAPSRPPADRPLPAVPDQAGQCGGRQPRELEQQRRRGGGGRRRQRRAPAAAACPRRRRPGHGRRRARGARGRPGLRGPRTPFLRQVRTVLFRALSFCVLGPA